MTESINPEILSTIVTDANSEWRELDPEVRTAQLTDIGSGITYLALKQPNGYAEVTQTLPGGYGNIVDGAKVMVLPGQSDHWAVLEKEPASQPEGESSTGEHHWRVMAMSAAAVAAFGLGKYAYHRYRRHLEAINQR